MTQSDKTFWALSHRHDSLKLMGFKELAYMLNGYRWIEYCK